MSRQEVCVSRVCISGKECAMRTVRRSVVVGCLFICMAVAVRLVLADDVVVKQGGLTADEVTVTGLVEAERFACADCTASYASAVAFGYNASATSNCSIATGANTEASGMGSIAMGLGSSGTEIGSVGIGVNAAATGARSVAIGESVTAGTASWATAIGYDFTNNVGESFAVGYDDVDFRVEDGEVRVFGDLTVDGTIWGDLGESSCFYDKGVYGPALDYVADSTQTIKQGSDGTKQYDHEADPEFLKVWADVKDYDSYAVEYVDDPYSAEMIERRIYDTHKELRTNTSVKIEWLRQCVYELKQENEALKVRLAALEAAVGAK